ncbi:MAG: DEAD/DEAH box helicase [Candidatus Bathyarchaeota archaeon]|nr:DEAD/DEAH box helicase [Candidatus Bathyarchaeota archaeon]MDH5532269.1 DEAD/DEAH box helicase [Candidatus Bathyarchaeota archaeon]MDH5712310.1 DEAD/DEAH box helicase [Candidatus Bathyarchaeota archaeon]
MEPPKNAFKMLVKPIRRLIEQKGFEAPTEPQEKTIPKILEGKNVLLISPTATGKTEAAVLPVLHMLLQTPERRRGIKILYITPLKALNRDLLERLELWCNHLDVRLAVRHGDTDTRERTRQARSPPDMLITTPETLQAVLPGRLMRQHLQEVRWVIVDEVHEMADSKRGSQLSLALERLRWVTGKDFQVIGLSATIGSPEKVAQFLVGKERKVEIVRVPVARLMELEILFPQPSSEDYELASALFTHPEVATRLRIIRQFIEKQKSVLLFTNTRSASEVLASRFKVWDIDFPVSIHHGSLAKPSRIAAERGLKNGELKGLVCTSSLELGIDVGRIDLVIQYMSPRQVTRLIQRVGRSGHRIGRIAKGLIVTMDSDDTLEAMVIARMAYREELEPVTIPPKPYDVLAHQIIGLLMKKKRWYFYEIYDLFKNAYPYADLTLEDIERVLTYMHSRFPRLAWVSFEDMLAIKPRRTKAMYEYYFGNLSMIPNEKKYLVVDETSESAVGILDEAFMAEYGKPGVKFIIRGSPWRIINVSSDHVYVKSVDDPTGAIPSWVGEEIPVPFEVAQEVGWIRGFVEEQMRSGVTPEEAAAQLAEKYPANKDAVLRAMLETVEQVGKGYLVPTDKRIVIEDWEDFVIIHANFGSLTNRALAQLVGHILSEQTGYTVTVQHDPYRIFIQTMGAANADYIVARFDEMKKWPDSVIRDKLIGATVKTGIFKRRMVHVARRFGALKKWVDFSRVSLRSLIKSFEDTAIYDEALKETFTKDLDLQNTIQVLNGIRNGEFEVRKLETEGVTTPIARVGLERASMKTDLIAPERMRLILIESAKARLLNETRTFVCTNCWDYIKMIRIKDLPNKPECPKCGSPALGVLRQEEDEAGSLVEKKGERLTKIEQKWHGWALETAQLMAKHGKPAAVALSGRRLKSSEANEILRKERELTDRFFELLIEAEKKALKRRFW